MDILITGVLLGATYSLIAMGLTLQYGVARIMNLANGEMLVAGAFGAFWVFTAQKLSPYAAALYVVPGAFLLNWLIYR
jgi:branched-chain amino acid transport system permease protein